MWGIDHDVRCVEDTRWVERLAAEQKPLTVCPLANVKLRVFDSIEQHNLKELLGLGLCATVNSDDPAYFGGYMTENFLAVQQALALDRDELQRLVRNSFEAAFLDQAERQRFIQELDSYVADTSH